MAVAKVQLPDGSIATLEVPDGTTPEALQAFLEQQFKPVLDPKDDPSAPRNAPRQRPQPPRDGALDKAARFLETNPVSKFGRGVMQPFVGAIQAAANLTPMADEVNRYVSEEERGYQAQRGDQAGTFDPLNVAGQATTYVGTLGRVAPFGAASTAARAGNAAIQGGIAGATQTVQGAEEGGGRNFAIEKAKQTGIGAVTGAVLAPPLEWATTAVIGAANAFLNGARSLGNRLLPMNTTRLEQELRVNLQQQGIDWATLSRQVQRDLVREAERAARAGGRLDPEAAARLAEFESLGIQPLRSWVTRDPVQFTREANLGRVQANQEGGAIVDAQIAGNRALTENLNQMGAAQAGSRVATGERTIESIVAQANARQARVRQLYDAANEIAGGDIPLDAAMGLQQVIRRLELEGKLPYLEGEGALVNSIIDGSLPLTVSRAEGIKSTLADAIRTAQRAGDGNRVFALSQAYEAIENAMPATQLGAQAMAAFRRARNAARANFQWRESTPAVRAALDNVAPDQFFERFILNRSASIRDVAALREAMTPELATQNRNLIVQHLRDAAAKNAGRDANAIFSQDKYNSALRKIGDEKLALFFTPQELMQLRAIGNAAYNMVAQPKGSAVNNSNTASALFSLLDRFMRRVPFGEAGVSRPVAAITQQRLESQATQNPQFFTPGQVVDPDAARRLVAPFAPALGAAGAAVASP